MEKCYNALMFEVRVTADFAAAHFLGGMLLDFTKLKGALRTVCKQLDHTNLNDMSVFDQNPSAERIAMYIYNGIIENLKKEGLDLSYQKDKKTPALYAVDVFETETSRARYRVDE